MLPLRGHLARLLKVVVTGAAAMFLYVSEFAAQLPRPRWTVSGGGTAIRMGRYEGWGFGPELRLRRDFGEHWGVGLTLSLPAFGGVRAAAWFTCGPGLFAASDLRFTVHDSARAYPSITGGLAVRS